MGTYVSVPSYLATLRVVVTNPGHVGSHPSRACVDQRNPHSCSLIGRSQTSPIKLQKLPHNLLQFGGGSRSPIGGFSFRLLVDTIGAIGTPHLNPPLISIGVVFAPIVLQNPLELQF